MITITSKTIVVTLRWLALNKNFISAEKANYDINKFQRSNIASYIPLARGLNIVYCWLYLVISCSYHLKGAFYCT